MNLTEFIAEQNRLNRTKGLRRDEPGGEIEPQDYPMHPDERAYLIEGQKLLEEQMELLEKDLGNNYDLEKD